MDGEALRRKGKQLRDRANDLGAELGVLGQAAATGADVGDGLAGLSSRLAKLRAELEGDSLRGWVALPRQVGVREEDYSVVLRSRGLPDHEQRGREAACKVGNHLPTVVARAKALDQAATATLQVISSLSSARRKRPRESESDLVSAPLVPASISVMRQLKG